MGSKRKGYAANAFVKTAKTIEVRNTILAACHERGDAWADAVQARILHVHDLHAADAVYHQVCSVTRNRYQHAQFMRAAPKEQNWVGHKTERGHKHSWRLLVF